MAYKVLFLVLISLNFLVCSNYAKTIMALDSEGRKHNGTGVVSPGQWIVFTCPHSDVTKWSVLRLTTTLSLISNDNIAIDGNKLKINKVNFNDSGLYYCEQNAAAYRFFLHVLKITETKNGIVPITVVSNEINGQIYNQSKVNERESANMSCFCNGGTKDTQIIINWKGGLYSKLSDFYTINTTRSESGLNSVLTLKKASNDKKFYGEYTCSCNVISGTSIEKKVYLEAPPMFVEHDYSKRTTEGDNVTIDCNAWSANINPTITWSFQKNPTLRDGIIVKHNSTQPGFSQLIISKVTNADRGVYTCHASNFVGTNSASTMLRVKGRYAALWPFIGIVVQLVILIAIIVVYEYKKSTKIKEDTTRCNFDSKNEPDPMGSERGNESVRQRLVKT